MRPAFVTAIATLFAAATVSASDKSAMMWTGPRTSLAGGWGRLIPGYYNQPGGLVARNIPTSFLDDDNKRAGFPPFGYPNGYWQNFKLFGSNKRSIESSEELEAIKKAFVLFESGPWGWPGLRPPPIKGSTFPITSKPAFSNGKASGKRSIESSEELDDIKKAIWMGEHKWQSLKSLLKDLKPKEIEDIMSKKALFPGGLFPTCMCIRAPCPCGGSSRFPYYRDPIKTHQPSGNKRSIESSEELDDIKKAAFFRLTPEELEDIMSKKAYFISPGPMLREDLRREYERLRLPGYGKY